MGKTSNRPKATQFPIEEQPQSFQFGNDEPPPEPFPLEINGETLMCVGEVDGLRLLEYTAQMRRATDVGTKAAAVTEWLQDCIVDYDLFKKVVAKYRLDIDDVVDVARYLAEVYGNRPTRSAESSSAGQTTTGSSSEDEPSLKD